jgi:hypothetical protein
MWRLVILPCIFAISVQADPNDLSGGVFILHSPPEINWSCFEQYGACDGYDECGFGIQSCDEQNPRIDDQQETLWYVIAAWTEEKTWCGLEFGLGSYPPDLFAFVAWGPCFPVTGLEIPSSGFPGPNTGTSVTATDPPWSGNFRPVYYFAGYAPYVTPGQIPLTVRPGTEFGGFGNCDLPYAELFPAACFGSLGLFEPGVTCCPEPPVPHVCCVDEKCVLADSEYECTSLAGIWHPEWDSCGPPDPCSGIPAGSTTWGSVKTLYR